MSVAVSERQVRAPETAEPEKFFAPQATGLRRGVYLALGGLFVVVGAIGALLPGLPTTPFLLLASYFFVRSSPRLNAALQRSRWFGPLLRDWQAGRCVQRKVKLQAVLLIIVFVGAAMVLADSFGKVQLTTLGFGLLGLTVVARLPEAPTAERRHSDQGEA